MDNQLSASNTGFDGNGNPSPYLGQSASYDEEDRLTGVTTPSKTV